MRKFLLLFITASSFIAAKAQVSDADVAMAKQLVAKNATAIGLSAEDQQNAMVSSTYKTMDGLRMVYLQQSYLGIPVYNQLQVLAFQNDKVVSNAGGRIPNIQKSIRGNNGMPAVSVVEALQTALADAKATALEAAVPIYTSADGHKFEFGKLGATTENIKADLLWYPLGERGEIKLVWQLFVTPKNASAYWLIRVDANNGQVVDRTNLTITCNWDHKGHSLENHLKENHGAAKAGTGNYVIQQPAKKWTIRPDVISSASYRVVKYPAESPIHPGGTPSLHVDPWLMAGAPAASLGWHDDGTTLHDSTRGNNVWAQEDRDNNNTTFGKTAISTTPQPTLTFDFVYDFAQAPTVTENQKFAITNLFYWNNIIHDISYVYGFDEPTGNFQNNNQGRGGAGIDYVIADAQDAGGTNNANFGTGADGSRPRMQMYLWTAPNPDRDGDMDNSIVVHEYTHGISNRYTGGPATASCLGNSEQGGEGWSDYFALMSTTNWATATVNDGPNKRGIGTYALNQAITGTGIRRFPYSTDMSIYPLTYADMPGSVVPHGTGEIWCMMLWEMTWQIIQQDNAINPNLFTPGPTPSMIGNSAALKLVSEGMRLQPCNPGYVDARNAILKADTLLFNKKYSCSIWKAFAKRGLGRLASQGSANSTTDGIADYTVDASAFKLTESVPQIPEGQNMTYTNTVTAGNCTPVSNFFITDTLPTNVTYVSGGSYNGANRTITFSPISLAANASQTYPFTVTVNNGTYFAPVTHLNEPVAGASIPAAWTATSANAVVWSVSATESHSAPNSFFAPNSTTLQTDLQLATSVQYNITPNSVSNYTTLSFWHKYNTEDGWDGGVVEISTDNGASWSDVGASRFIQNGYNGSLGTGSNLAGRSAFTGTNGAAFIQSVVNLSSFVGQNIKIRFRFGSDNNTGPASGVGGWWVDDIVLNSEPAVQIRSNLFNSSSVRQSFSDTIVRITQVAVCIPVSVTTQPPATINACAGSNTTISVVAAGTAPVYQWQVNTGSGFVNVPVAAPYSGGTTSTLTITGITAGMNGYLYRCVLSNTCTPAFNSGTTTLVVGSTASITGQPANSTICTGANTSFSITATSASFYKWQVNTGSGFVDVPAAAPYSGVTTATLTITGATAVMSGYQYRCVVGSCGGDLNSNAATLTISVPVSVTTQPANVTVCEGAAINFTVGTTGSVISYQWQVSTDAGVTYTNIAGATTSSFAIPIAMIGQNGYRFRVVVTGSCGPVNSTGAILTVNPLPVFTLNNLPQTLCLSDQPVALSASISGGVWSGTGVSGSTFSPSVAGLGSKTVTYTVTALGCAKAVSSTIQVNECGDRHVPLNRYPAIYLGPNPTRNGRFNIWVNTDLYTRLGMKVFNSLGALVKTEEFNGIGYGSVIPVDLSRMPSGTYHLYIYNNEGTFISRGESVIVVRE